MNINTFEQNFSTFDKLKTSPEEEEKYSVPQNLNDEKNKKGLSDLTNILKNHKPNIPLKNPKKSVGPESNNRINFEISDLHCDISNKIKKVLIFHHFFSPNSIFLRVIQATYRNFRLKMI
jgi:hypothetical protein